MAVTETIQELLQGIDDAQYGRDMRQFIHKSIQKCYEEGSAGETDLPARESIEKILEIFGDVESTSTASKAYSIGDSVVYDGRLYKVISAINQGDTLTEGTNIEETKAVSNISDIYELPFTHSGSSKLFIIPAIQLMILNIAETYSVSGGKGGIIGSQLPLVWGLKSYTYMSTARTTVIATPTDTSHTGAIVGTASIQIMSTQQDGNFLMLDLAQTITESMSVKGLLIAPYYRLNSNHPFSDATPLTWDS